jgi:hypothetical protein
MTDTTAGMIMERMDFMGKTPFFVFLRNEDTAR